MTKYLMGIDAGSTSIKSVLFDEAGNVIASASSESMRFKVRGKGFEEFGVDDLWVSTSKCIKETIQRLISIQRILSVSELLPLEMDLSFLIRMEILLLLELFHMTTERLTS